MTRLTAFGDRVMAEDEARRQIPRRLRHTPTGSAPGELVLHPLWVAWTHVIAGRPPFRPVVRPTLVFVDAVSEYRGLLGSLPATQEIDVTGYAVSPTVPSARVDEPRARELVEDVQSKQVNRSYVLRKPRHELRRLELLHLPLWRFDPGDIAGSGGSVATVNAVTGDDESYLASRWP